MFSRLSQARPEPNASESGRHNHIKETFSRGSRHKRAGESDPYPCSSPSAQQTTLARSVRSKRSDAETARPTQPRPFERPPMHTTRGTTSGVSAGNSPPPPRLAARPCSCEAKLRPDRRRRAGKYAHPKRPRTRQGCQHTASDLVHSQDGHDSAQAFFTPLTTTCTQQTVFAAASYPPSQVICPGAGVQDGSAALRKGVPTSPPWDACRRIARTSTDSRIIVRPNHAQSSPSAPCAKAEAADAMFSSALPP